MPHQLKETEHGDTQTFVINNENLLREAVGACRPRQRKPRQYILQFSFGNGKVQLAGHGGHVTPQSSYTIGDVRGIRIGTGPTLHSWHGLGIRRRHVNSCCLQPALPSHGPSSIAATCAGLCPLVIAHHEQPSEHLNGTRSCELSHDNHKQVFSDEPYDEIASASAGKLHAHWQYARGATAAMQHCERPVGHDRQPQRRAKPTLETQHTPHPTQRYALARTEIGPAAIAATLTPIAAACSSAGASPG